MAPLPSPLARATTFSSELGVRVPILLSPMAGACPPALSIAVANAGGLGACGALPFDASAIRRWCEAVRTETTGPFQVNLWIPGPAPARDAAHEASVREFLAGFGPAVPPDADAKLVDFDIQCDAIIETRPRVVSTIMGLFAPEMVERLERVGIQWYATVTTVAEARAAEAAGADAIIAQGMEAGGHRGAFDPSVAERDLVGLFSLVPAIVDAVSVPVIAAGGIADGRGIAAALLLGASAVQIGTAFLRCPEAGIPSSWANALADTAPEATVVTRAFSGRPGRALATRYVRAAAAEGAPAPAPYPVQRGLTAAMRESAAATDDVGRMQAWSGQSAALARPEPAGEALRRMWSEAVELLGA